MPRKIPCRYGKNGYFGVCSCDECRRIVVVTDKVRVEYLQETLGLDLKKMDEQIRARELGRRGLVPTK